MFQKKSRGSFIIACLLSLFITALLCTPGSQFPKVTWKDKVFLDKWIHAALFASLVFAWCRAYYKRDITAQIKTGFLKIALAIFIYGIATEIIQEFLVPFRSFEIPDIIADGVGAIAGYFLALKRYIKK